MTVSRALREGTSVDPEVRERVRETAHNLGYQTDLRVSHVMSAMRKSEIPQYREGLAFIWTRSSTGRTADHVFYDKEFEGARRRADQLGYRLDEFHITDPKLNGRELSRLILSRGIRGVVIAPASAGLIRSHIWLDWQHFCCVLLGSSLANKGLARVEHDHYLGCVLAVRRLRRKRHQRIGLVLSPALDKRTADLIQSAFLSFHPLGSHEARKLIFTSDLYKSQLINKWIKKNAPDIFLARVENIHSIKKHFLYRNIPIATLSWNEAEPEIAGIDQHRFSVGEQTIDLLLERLKGNRFGLDPVAPSIRIPGSWMDGESLDMRPAKSSPSKRK